MNFRILSDDEIEVMSESSVETKQLGRLLGEVAFGGFAVLLHGELGAGKTVISQGIGQALGISRIKSPSFIIVSEYGGVLPLAHADLYRLENEKQIDELDFESYIEDGFLLVVEWGDRWKSTPSAGRLDIYIEQDTENQETRRIILKAAGEMARNMLSSIVNKLKEICI